MIHAKIIRVSIIGDNGIGPYTEDLHNHDAKFCLIVRFKFSLDVLLETAYNSRPGGDAVWSYELFVN